MAVFLRYSRALRGPAGWQTAASIWWSRRYRTLSARKEKKFSLEDDLLPSLLEQGRRLYGVEQSNPFIDVGIPEDYLRAAEILPR